MPRTARALALTCALAVIAACANNAMYVRPGVDQRCAECVARGDQLDSRVILIGDTGELESAQLALGLFQHVGSEDPNRTIALFLGDNIYPRGLPAAGEPEVPGDDEPEMARRILQQQVDAIESVGVRSIFVPGNHDWDRSGPRGLERMQAQAAYLEQNSPHAIVYPTAGCPGPTVLDVGARLRIIVIDSEWLLREKHPKLTECEWGEPGGTRPLDGADNTSVYGAVREAIAGAGERRVLLATHHPLKTLGSHGGRYPAKDYVFPLTHVASWLYLPVPLLYPALRTWVIRHDQDLAGGRNRAMVEELEAALTTAAKSPIVASGHEHSLQVFDDPDNPIWYLVSGGGSKTEPTGHADDTVFKRVERGIMVLDVHTDGRIGLRVIRQSEPPMASQIFGRWLEDRAGSE